YGLNPFGPQSVLGREMDELPVKPEHVAELSLTEPRGALRHGVKHRLHVSRRARDDAQHLRGRHLLFQRLAQFAGKHLDLLFWVDEGVLQPAKVAGIGVFHKWLIVAARLSRR